MISYIHFFIRTGACRLDISFDAASTNEQLTCLVCYMQIM